MATTKTLKNPPAGGAKKPAAKKAPKAKAALASKPGDIAIIATGGKQYVVSEGAKIKIEAMPGGFKEGDSIVFDQVLLAHKGSTTTVGAPTIEGAKVTGELVQIGRAPKVIVIKYKAKSRYFKKRGHKQPFFEVKVTSIA